MKIHGALALFALPGAFGFAPSNNNVAASTALFSSGAPVSGGPSVRTGPPGVDPSIAGGMAVAGGRPPAPAPDGALERFAVKYDSIPQIVVQGGALRTWSFPTMGMGRVNLALTTQGPPEGNPLNCDISFNEGPDNTPQRMRVYSGKGRLRPFKMWIETPSDTAAVFIRNLAPLEFPCEAKVGTEYDDLPPSENTNVITDAIYEMGKPSVIQGAGALRSYALDPVVSSVKVVLTTDGRPLNAMVELVQGPNAPKYTIEVYSEDGMVRPFTAVLETPGAGNELRIVNTASMEFPLTAAIGRSGQWPL
jgi:hypothetical protein